MRTLWNLLVETANHLIVEPIQVGHLRPSTWPTSLRAVMAVVGLAFAAAVALIVGAPWFRRLDEPVILNGNMVIGFETLTVVTWLTTVAMAVGLTAVLHMHPVGRVLGLLLLLPPLVSTAVQFQWLLPSIAIALILLIFAVRWRSSFAAWEFAVLWIIVCAGMLGPHIGEANYGFDTRPYFIVSVTSGMSALATPAIWLTGYLAAQISATFAQRLGKRSNQVLPATVVAVVAITGAVGYLALASYQSWQGVAGWWPENWIGSLTLAVGAAAVGLLLRLFTPGPGEEPSHPEAIDRAWTPLAIALAALGLIEALLSNLIVVAVGITDSLSVTPAWLVRLESGNEVTLVAAVIQLLVGIGLTVLMVRRRNRPAALALVCFTATIGSRVLTLILPGLGLWHPGPVSVLLVAVALILHVVTRKRITRGQLLTIVLLVWAYNFREILSDPSAIFVGVSAALFLIAGLTWRVLTDGDLVRGHSRAFPQSARVLLFGTIMLLAAQGLAVIAQIRVPGTIFDELPAVRAGDEIFGGALFLAVGVASLVAMAIPPAQPLEPILVPQRGLLGKSDPLDDPDPR